MSDVRFNGDGLVLSDRYADTMNGAVLPWLEARCERMTVSGADGRPLSVRRYALDGARGSVMILHGFTESALKFSELIHSLLRNGYAVVAYDQRGHGASWRDPRLGDLSLTHVDRFDEYVRDASAVADAAMAGLPRPWIALAHSMGGAVTACLMERRRELFDRAVLSSPMIAPVTGVPAWTAAALCRVMGLFGQSAKRALISKPFAGPEDFATAAANGKARFDWYDAIRVSTPIYQNNGPSYGWTLAGVMVTREILKPGAPEGIACPVRVYTAALDTVVVESAQEAFIRRVPKGERLTVAGAKHEIYRSSDEVLFPWWHGVLGWLGEA